MTTVVNISSTPNENAMKFTVDQILLASGHKTFNNPEQASESALAKKLFEIEGVASVFLIQDFITVTKNPEAKWVDIQEKIIEGIKTTI